MKKILRSKSDTNIFFDKESLDLIHENMNKFKISKGPKLEFQKRSKVKKSMNSYFAVRKKSTCQDDSENSVMIGDVSNNNNSNQESSNMFGSLNLKGIESNRNLNSALNFMEESLEETFKKHLKQILKFKLEFDRLYLERIIVERKAYVNIILEIILLNLKKFKENYIRGLNNDSVYESPMSVSRFENPRNGQESQSPFDPLLRTPAYFLSTPGGDPLKENFEKFERILEILIQTSPEELFREVKSLILNEYDKTTLEIQGYLERRKNGTVLCKLFTWISQSILYMLSKVSFKLDIYSLTVNCLVEKMNRIFVDFVEKYSNLCYNDSLQVKNKFFSKSLNIILRFIKLKKYFIKEFCQNNKSDLRYHENSTTNLQGIMNTPGPTYGTSPTDSTQKTPNINNVNNDKFKFSFNKFNSFGRYLFNNCSALMNIQNYNNSPITISNKEIFRNLTSNFNKSKGNSKLLIEKMKNKLLVIKFHSSIYVNNKEGHPNSTFNFSRTNSIAIQNSKEITTCNIGHPSNSQANLLIHLPKNSLGNNMSCSSLAGIGSNPFAVTQDITGSNTSAVNMAPKYNHTNSSASMKDGPVSNQHHPNSPPKRTHLDVYFKLYFTFKLANWKYTSIQSENFTKKNEICRICENTFTISDFILHISFCKEQRLYYQKLIDLNKDLNYSLEALKRYKDKLVEDDGMKMKDILFSPKSEFTKKFKMHLYDKTPKLKHKNSIVNSTSGKKEKSENELLDILITALGKEKETTYEDYEKQPYKLSHLVSIIHFTVLVFSQNKICNSFSNELNEIFSRLFNGLMKKMFVVENILTLQDNRERAKMRNKNFYIKKQASLMNTPLIKFRESQNRDSMINLNYIRNISGSQKDVTMWNYKKDSPSKKQNSSAKEFMMMLDDAQTKLKKMNNASKSPLFSKRTLNTGAQISNQKTTTSSFFPKPGVNKINLNLNLNLTESSKNLPNPLNKYLSPSLGNRDIKLGTQVHLSSGSVTNLPTSNPSTFLRRESLPSSTALNKIKQIGKELKMFAGGAGQIKEVKEFKNEENVQPNEGTQVQNEELNSKKNLTQIKSILSQDISNVSVHKEVISKTVEKKDSNSDLDIDVQKPSEINIINVSLGSNLLSETSYQLNSYMINCSSSKINTCNNNSTAGWNVASSGNTPEIFSRKNVKINNPFQVLPSSNSNFNEILTRNSENSNNTQYTEPGLGISTQNEIVDLPNSDQQNSEGYDSLTNIFQTYNEDGVAKTIITSPKFISSDKFNKKSKLNKMNLLKNLEKPSTKKSLFLNNSHRENNCIPNDQNNPQAINQHEDSHYSSSHDSSIMSSDGVISLNVHDRSIPNQNEKLPDTVENIIQIEKEIVNNIEKKSLELKNGEFTDKYNKRKPVRLNTDPGKKTKSLICNSKNETFEDNEEIKMEELNKNQNFDSVGDNFDNFDPELHIAEFDNDDSEVDSQFDEIIDLMDEIQLSEDSSNEMTIINDENEQESSGNSQDKLKLPEKHKNPHNDHNDDKLNSKLDLNSNDTKSLKEQLNMNKTTLLNPFNSSKDKIKDKSKDHTTSTVHNNLTVSNQMKISDFKFLKEIAKGGYGRVDIYKKVSTGDIYAIKTVNIKKMRAKNVSALLKKETMVFNEIFSDYVVKCFWMFSDNINYYYVMEYMPGGNLLNFLNKYIPKNETIQLIVAEVLLSLEYLHSINIVHRDLKPENIVISYDSHFKLTDFGISDVGLNQNKYAISNYNIDADELEVKSNAILGTEHYLAPEVIKGENLTSQIDYWSLGVLIYELYTNKVPFMDENFTKIADNIVNLKINWQPFDNLINEPDYSIDQLNNAKNLILKFLDLDPSSRWGYNNIDEVKKHEFFTNFDWKNIKNITDPIVKKYVLEQIKEVNKKPAGKEPSLNVSQRMDTTQDLNDTLKINQSVNDANLTVEYENKNFMNTQRVDNLFAKCQEVIKNNIKQKTLNIDTGDDKFTDLLNDIID